jgi:sugar phosphate isomerase/epimerase
MTTPHISVQIYSLREAGDFDAQLALARAAGFEWIESVAGHGLPPDEFAAKVAAHGLRVSSMHVALTMAEGDLDHVIALCRASGCPLVVVPWLPMGERAATAAGWRAIGTRLAAIGDQLNAAGLRLAYHNHEFEFLHYDGRTALEWIFSSATPAQLGWEADLGWVSRAGVAASAVVDAHADRLVCVHAKDIAPPSTAVDEDGWCALGQGIVPWAALFAQLKPRIKLFVLEHDKPKDHAAMLKTSFAFMQQHLG